jgi:hypothetical protein
MEKNLNDAKISKRCKNEAKKLKWGRSEAKLKSNYRLMMQITGTK